jgi:hypothetical protein
MRPASRRAGAAKDARHVTASDTSLCRMDPTVIAAAIGVGGTVIVAVAGFSTAVWTAKETISHARESRVWDRRADVYIEALAAVNYRQIKRGFETLTHPVDDQARQRMQAYLAGHEQDWPGLEARLHVFASEPVFSAVQASSTAHRDAIKFFETWRHRMSCRGVPTSIERPSPLRWVRHGRRPTRPMMVLWNSYAPSYRAEGGHWPTGRRSRSPSRVVRPVAPSSRPGSSAADCPLSGRTYPQLA